VKKFTRFFMTFLVVLFVGFLLTFVFLGDMSVLGALRPSIYYALIVLGVPVIFRYGPLVLRKEQKRYRFFSQLLLIYLLYVGVIILFLYFSEVFDILRFHDVMIAAVLLAFRYMLLHVLISFSIVYVIYAFMATYAPIVLNIIHSLTKRNYGKKNVPWRGNAKYHIIGYLFNVPRFIDTNKLTISARPRKQNMFGRFITLLLIMMFLTALLVIYIGLNPFITSDYINKVILIDISLNIAALIPILVFPIYLFYMIGPKIVCGNRDYDVSKGLRKRLTGILITATTILILFRLVVERTSGQTLLLALLKFLIAVPGLMISILIFMVIFENIIVQNTITLFIKDKVRSQSFLSETEKKLKEWILD